MQQLEPIAAIYEEKPTKFLYSWKLQEETDLIFRKLTAACAGLILIFIGGIVIALLHGSFPSISRFGIGFLSSWEWVPSAGKFGALSSIYGTLITTVIALILAVPLSLAITVFLVELAHPLVSRTVGNALELLAAVPSIIFGMWGLFALAPVMSAYVQPFLAKYLGFLPLFQGDQTGIGIFTAGIVLALMVLPFISAVMVDVFKMIPNLMKEAGYSMGATTWEVTRDITIRYGFQGMIGACLLGLGRAIGETMAVAFVIGNRSRISSSLFAPGNSIASRLVNDFTEASEPLHLSALMGLGLVLFAMTFSIQVFTQLWLRHFRKEMRGEPA
jgi:phosphate transport system permease protein